jgi:hypothetical protein
MPGVQSVTVGWERYGAQTDVEYFNERMREEKDSPSFEVKELNWVREGDQSKAARVQRLEPDFRQSRFFLPGIVWNPDIVGHNGYQHPDRICTWKVGPSRDPGNKAQVILYTPVGEQMPEVMRKVDLAGQPYRKAQAIKRVELLGEAEHRQTTIYDLTRVLIEEMRLFPFSPRDDLVDATSRYVDLEPVSPMLIEEAAAAAPAVYHDS